MDDQLQDGLRSLERQAFVNYVTVADRNGYSVAASGDASRQLAAYVREVDNFVHEMFPGVSNVRVVVEGSQKSVVIGEKGEFVVGVQITNDKF